MLNYTRLGELIKASNMNKTALATKCKVSRVTIDNLLQGGDVRLSTLNTIAQQAAGGLVVPTRQATHGRCAQRGVRAKDEGLARG